MSYKKKSYWILLGSIVGFIIAVVLTSPSSLGLCPAGDRFCFDPYDEIIGQPLGIFSVCLFFLSLILLIMHEQVFRVWLKFAVIFLPVAIILIAITPSTSGSIDPIEREPVTLFLAVVFFVTSLIIIAIKSFRLRGK